MAGKTRARLTGIVILLAAAAFVAARIFDMFHGN